MSNQSSNSMSFVISMAYTFTFANAIFLITTDDPTGNFDPNNITFELERSICGAICLIMTLRFFFGNNQYISDVMDDDSRGAWQKFHQFFFIALQSVILLISSYAIPYTVKFVQLTTALFVIETVWYAITFFVDPCGVRSKDGSVDVDFLKAQIFNFWYWVSSLIFLSIDVGASLLSVFVGIIFIINTAWDVRKNISYYMGVR